MNSLRSHPIIVALVGGLLVLAIWFYQRVDPPMLEQIKVGWLPDPRLTPGEVDSRLTVDQICHQSTRLRRRVSESLKRRVRTSYGMVGKHDLWCNTSEACEIDHRVPLAVGGTNAQANLWPEPYSGQHSAHEKDLLEDKMHLLLCSGKVSLSDAQNAFLGNWINSYHKYVK